MFTRLRRAFAGPAAAPSFAATPEDIAACFRLLLDRQPNAEELRGHLSRVGQDLPGVVASYLNSLEFSRRGLLEQTAGVPSVAELDVFRLYAMADDDAVGRHVLHGQYEPEVEALFRRVLRPGMGVVDLGANIGYFTMLSAALVGPDGFVLAVEPNPDNARLLEASRRLNGFAQIVVAQLAAGRSVGLLALNAAYSNGTTSGLSEELAALLQARTVPCVPVDRLLDRNRRIDLIKVDVEGAEYNALLGAAAVIAAYKPRIISEFSPDLMPGISGIDGPGYLRFLYGSGYTVSVVQKDGTLLDTGQDAEAVMAAYQTRGSDHIDLFAV